jgi:hypothetical protein
LSPNIFHRNKFLKSQILFTPQKRFTLMTSQTSVGTSRNSQLMPQSSSSAFNRHSASGNASRSCPRFSIPATHLRPRQAAQWRMLDPKVFQVSFARGDATTKLGVSG